MAYNQDQMDNGPAGRLRGQPTHVRIPQRTINRSLRTGVSPSMQQPHNGVGHFQSNPIISGRLNQFRPYRPQKSNLYQQFMNRNKQPDLFDRLGGQRKVMDFKQRGHNPVGDPRIASMHVNPNSWGRREKMQDQQENVFSHLNHNGFNHGGLPGQQQWQGGHPPIGVGPILGHGQDMNGMVQAIMDDLQNGINPAQYANMQAGNLPGGEHGDFLRALGGGAQNNAALQALITHLTQGAAGADGTPGNYTINGDQGAQISQILRQAIGHNPNYNPPSPPRGLGQGYMGPPIGRDGGRFGVGGGRRGGFGGGYMPSPYPGGGYGTPVMGPGGTIHGIMQGPPRPGQMIPLMARRGM